jgi:hypothetical protein
MQNTTLDILKTGANVFITGSAGTGKTYILNKYIVYLKQRGIKSTIVAPTAIAASHLQGQTIHSYFSLGINDMIDNSFIEKLLTKKYLQTRFKNLKILIIDEISMVSPNIFLSIDMILQAFKQNNKPFGGIQVILSGDFFQLPPIIKNGSNKKFAWQCRSWKELDLQTCYLEKKYRQNDDDLIFILDEIRDAKISQKTYDILNSRLNAKLDIDFIPTKLYTHNLDVDRINNNELDKLNTKPFSFEYKSEGTKSNIEKLFKSSLVPEKLILKKDAVVMFIKNNSEKNYINGTTGIVVDFSKDDNLPMVKLSTGDVIKVDYEDWSIENENGKIVAHISQIPLKLAWAITIHKSQGMTLDAAQIDLSKTFEVGQGYVSLSRIKNINGLKLLGYNDMSLQVDPLILSIDSRIKQASLKSINKISIYSKEQLKNIFDQYILKLGGTIHKHNIEKNKRDLQAKPKIEKKIANHLKTKKYIDSSNTLDELSKNANFSISTIIKHLKLIKDEDQNFDLSKFTPSSNKIDKIKQAIDNLKNENNLNNFTENNQLKLKPIYEKLNKKISYDDIKLVMSIIKL